MADTADTDTRAREKKQRLLTALDKGLAQVHLDARRPGVIVPPDHRVDPHLVLNLSYRFDPPDLSVSEWGVRETLSFRGERFTVGLPWSSIYAIAADATRELWMYPEDMPEELLQGSVKAQVTDLPREAGVELGSASPRAILKEVVTDGGLEKPPTSSTPARRGHLRVVK